MYRWRSSPLFQGFFLREFKRCGHGHEQYSKACSRNIYDWEWYVWVEWCKTGLVCNVQIVPGIPAKESTRERRFCKINDCWLKKMLLAVSLIFLLLGSCLKTHELNISLERKHLVLRFSLSHTGLSRWEEFEDVTSRSNTTIFLCRSFTVDSWWFWLGKGRKFLYYGNGSGIWRFSMAEPSRLLETWICLHKSMVLNFYWQDSGKGQLRSELQKTLVVWVMLGVMLPLICIL